MNYFTQLSDLLRSCEDDVQRTLQSYDAAVARLDRVRGKMSEVNEVCKSLCSSLVVPGSEPQQPQAPATKTAKPQQPQAPVTPTKTTSTRKRLFSDLDESFVCSEESESDSDSDGVVLVGPRVLTPSPSPSPNKKRIVEVVKHAGIERLRGLLENFEKTGGKLPQKTLVTYCKLLRVSDYTNSRHNVGQLVELIKDQLDGIYERLDKCNAILAFSTEVLKQKNAKTLMRYCAHLGVVGHISKVKAEGDDEKKRNLLINYIEIERTKMYEEYDLGSVDSDLDF